MKLRLRILLGLLATILTLLATRLTEAPADVPRLTEAPTQAISEDDADWDCRTMGNRICGEWSEQLGKIELVQY